MCSQQGRKQVSHASHCLTCPEPLPLFFVAKVLFRSLIGQTCFHQCSSISPLTQCERIPCSQSMHWQHYWCFMPLLWIASDLLVDLENPRKGVRTKTHGKRKRMQPFLTDPGDRDRSFSVHALAKVSAGTLFRGSLTAWPRGHLVAALAPWRATGCIHS